MFIIGFEFFVISRFICFYYKLIRQSIRKLLPMFFEPINEIIEIYEFVLSIVNN